MSLAINEEFKLKIINIASKISEGDILSMDNFDLDDLKKINEFLLVVIKSKGGSMLNDEFSNVFSSLKYIKGSISRLEKKKIKEQGE